MPRAVAITRLDHPRADFDETVALCQRVFGEAVLPLYLPMLGDDGRRQPLLLRRARSAADLITQRVFDYTEGYPPAVREPDPEHLPAIADARNELIEGIIAESEDETLMERYLGGEEIDADDAHRGPGEGRRPGHVLPGGTGLRVDPARPRCPARAADRAPSRHRSSTTCPPSPRWTARRWSR